MNILKNINILRRKLMHKLTYHIGYSPLKDHNDLAGKVEIKRILICRPNHRLGNLLLITPLLKEVAATFPGCKIDLFLKGNVAPIIFKNYEHINHIIQLPKKPFTHLIKYIQGWIKLKKNRYDLVINPVYYSSSGRLSTQFSRARYKFFGESDEPIQSEYPDHKHVAKYPVYALRKYLARIGFPENNKAVPSVDLKLSPLEIAEGQKTLRGLVKNENKTISIFTYATGEKCFSESWWKAFYGRLKIAYADYNLIEILPVENISKIAFQAPSFYSRDIREIGSLIANTEVFIGADSGMMHLASAAQTPTIGLFSVTNKDAYGPYNNNSISLKVNDDNTDECIKAINAILNKE